MTLMRSKILCHECDKLGLEYNAKVIDGYLTTDMAPPLANSCNGKCRCSNGHVFMGSWKERKINEGGRLVKPIVVIDFDGVIHSYDQRWVDFDIIPDPPVPGAIEFLRNIIKCDKFQVHIFSSRNVPTKEGGTVRDTGYASHCGKMAMKRYLIENGLDIEEVNQITFPDFKPPAHLTIDDRAIQFKGEFPSIGFIENFKPWNGKDDGYEE